MIPRRATNLYWEMSLDDGSVPHLIKQGLNRFRKIYPRTGICAYADHARLAGKDNAKVNDFVYEALAFLTTPKRDDLGAMLQMCLRAGEANLWTMETLYEANSMLGTPEPTQVPVAPTPGKCILISGHDLVVMESLLKACEPLGIKVYTHGEMLPGHSYPKLKAYKSLAVNPPPSLPFPPRFLFLASLSPFPS